MPASGFAPHIQTDNGLGFVKVNYDFAKHGGATGTITLTDITLPTGAIVLGGGIDVLTAPLSGGSATVALQLGSTTIKTATAIASLTGAVALNTLPIKTTGTHPQLKVVIATAALTAGKMDVYLYYGIPTA